LRLELRRADGTTVATSKPEGAADATLDATAPAEDTYYLRVEEITRAGGPALAYRLEAEPYRPGFALSVEVDRFDAAAGGGFELKVACTRRDYRGPIKLSVVGIDPAPALQGDVIAAGKADTQLKVTLPPGLRKGLHHLRIVGTATAGGSDVTATAGTAPAVQKLFPRLLYPPIDLDGLVAVGVR
jgi:hypothetical protein